MNTLVDINSSFQNTVVGLSTIIYSRLCKPSSIDYLFNNLKEACIELNIKPIFVYDDLFEALLLLYSLGKIELNKNGDIIKI